MLRSNINNQDILNTEPGLIDLINTDEIDIILSQAKERLIGVVENRLTQKKDMIRLCLPLKLTTDWLEDTVGRRRFLIGITGDSATYNLLGSDDTVSFEVVKEITLSSESTTSSLVLSGMWKYYKIEEVALSGTLDYAYLIETSFELSHLYLTLHMIYKRLQALTNDNYSSKADYYLEVFDNSIGNLQYSFDSNEDGEITDDDISISNKETTILL